MNTHTHTHKSIAAGLNLGDGGRNEGLSVEFQPMPNGSDGLIAERAATSASGGAAASHDRWWEKSHRPFCCLDCRYRRELVRVYLTNVELICRHLVEERRGKLEKLMQDKARWSRIQMLERS